MAILKQAAEVYAEQHPSSLATLREPRLQFYVAQDVSRRSSVPRVPRVWRLILARASTVAGRRGGQPSRAAGPGGRRAPAGGGGRVAGRRIRARGRGGR